MKYKTYTGDLSKLSSCIKISGTAKGKKTVLKKLSKSKCYIPFEIDDDSNILIKFKDYLKGGLRSIKIKGIKVCEHVEPLGIDIKMSGVDYDSSYDICCITEYYKGHKFIFVEFKKGKIVWNDCGTYRPFDFNKCELSPNLYKLRHIIPVLYRRGLIDEKTFKNFIGKTREMRYYDA